MLPARSTGCSRPGVRYACSWKHSPSCWLTAPLHRRLRIWLDLHMPAAGRGRRAPGLCGHRHDPVRHERSKLHRRNAGPRPQAAGSHRMGRSSLIRRLSAAGTPSSRRRLRGHKSPCSVGTGHRSARVRRRNTTPPHRAHRHRRGYPHHTGCRHRPGTAESRSRPYSRMSGSVGMLRPRLPDIAPGTCTPGRGHSQRTRYHRSKVPVPYRT